MEAKTEKKSIKKEIQHKMRRKCCPRAGGAAKKQPRERGGARPGGMLRPAGRIFRRVQDQPRASPEQARTGAAGLRQGQED